jgi:hypothetical protein
MFDAARDDERGRGETGRFDPGDFGRRIREFAIDAHRVLRHPDSSLDELTRLDVRAFRLLGEAPGARTVGIFPWLLAVRQRIRARLESRSFEDQACLVA